MTGTSNNAPKAQIASISKDTTSIVAQLSKQYPLGKIVLFLHMHVYQDGAQYWELTLLQLQIWAVGIAHGSATYNAPTTLNHFSDDKKLHVPSVIATALPTAAPLGLSTTAHPPADITNQALLYQMHHNQMLMLSNPYTHGFGHTFQPQLQPRAALPFGFPASLPPYANITSAPASNASAPPSASATSSPSYVISLPQATSFEEFAAFYKLPVTNIAKLEILEVCLGDHAVKQLK
ncbi:hypothetical protein L208DRAFT_1380519 [Tricholoma matsutake]|nr:hypothetical protein L208DRAFT_1380519 [Tricholoma matsutake 945]